MKNTVFFPRRFPSAFRSASRSASRLVFRTVFLLLLFVFIFAVHGIGSAEETSELPLLDLSQDLERQSVIAQGTPTTYQGHPYSVQMQDPNTVFLVWNIGHGGYGGPMAVTTDGGKSWTRIDERLPEAYKTHKNCPSIYRLKNAEGKEFLWVFSSQPQLARILSCDGGKTWREEPSLGFPNVMAFSSIVPKNPGKQDGCYLGFFHQEVGNDGTVRNREGGPNGHLRVVQSETSDAGFTWSEPKCVCEIPGKMPCEPFAFLSPDQKEICCLMRENTHKGRSLVMFSSDRGETWTSASDTVWGLTGDRHMGVYTGNGRLVIAFRDTAPKSPTQGHFVAWVGTWDDIRNGRPGECRIKLLHNYAGWDCGYPGIFRLPDGTITALTYIKYRDGENKHSIVSIRFDEKMLENIQEQKKD